MKKPAIIGISLLLVCAVYLAAGRLKNTDTVTVSRLLRVYDGDTFFVDVNDWPPLFGKNIGIRIRGIDAPEMRDPCQASRAMAKMARDFAADKLAGAKTIKLKNLACGKYFRIVADVIADGNDLAKMLLTNGLAKEYDGGKKNE